LNGFEDSRIACTAALITGKGLANVFRFSRILRIVEGGKDHAWRAHAALRTAMFVESALDGHQSLVCGNPFDCGHSLSLNLTDGDHATQHQQAIHEDGTCATLALAASFLCSCETKIFAQNVQKTFHRIGGYLAFFAVDGK